MSDVVQVQVRVGDAVVPAAVTADPLVLVTYPSRALAAGPTEDAWQLADLLRLERLPQLRGDRQGYGVQLPGGHQPLTSPCFWWSPSTPIASSISPISSPSRTFSRVSSAFSFWS